MKLEQSIKPHHHLVIWIASLLLVVTSAVLYGNIAAQQTVATGTTETTNAFFGLSHLRRIEHDYLPPAVCRHATAANDTCRATMVSQSAAVLKRAIDGTDADRETLDKLDVLAAQTESTLAQLRSADIAAPVIDRLKKDIASIKDSTATLRTFLAKTHPFMQQFITLSNNDPLRAFALAQHHPSTDSAIAATDRLLNSLTDVVTILDRGF